MPQKKKVEVVTRYPHLTTKKQVPALLGLAGYYRCFVPNFFPIVSPLSDLTKKGQLDQVHWTSIEEWAFQRLKVVLTSSLVLQNLELSLPIVVHIDALKTGLGAMLSQQFKGEEHPVLYLSHKLSPTK